MVNVETARADVDDLLLTKTITYTSYSNVSIDSATDEQDFTSSGKSYKVKAQCTVQTIDSSYVSEGILNEGDLVGLFRYEYNKDVNGNFISPVIIPKSKDKITFLGQDFIIKQCTPETSDGEGVIAWDFTASMTGKNNFSLN